MANVAMDLAEWMTQLSNQLKDIPIINLAIPGKNQVDIQYRKIFVNKRCWPITGSHDTMTYGIGKRAKIAPDADAKPIVKKINVVLPCVVRRWAITQKLNVMQQLMQGIR